MNEKSAINNIREVAIIMQFALIKTTSSSEKKRLDLPPKATKKCFPPVGTTLVVVLISSLFGLNIHVKPMNRAACEG